MRNPLKRHYGQGDLHFITFNCYRRRALLGTSRARDRFVRILDEVRRRHGFRLVGYVVMPEHVHSLFSEAAQKNPSKILQVLKQKVAGALLKNRKRGTGTQLPLPFERGQTEEEHLLAATILRFQCVEREEAERETGIHACKSGAEKVGATSERLALEQLDALCGEKWGENADRSGPRRRRRIIRLGEESKPAPLKPKGAAPPKTNCSDSTREFHRQPAKKKEISTLSKTKNERVGHPDKKRQIQNRFGELRVAQQPRTLKVPVEVEFQWLHKSEAAHPGKAARLVWKPKEETSIA